MAGYEVSGMSHGDMMNMVKRRLNKLAMCKRGTIETDANDQKDKLGNCPAYTTEEREAITKALAGRMQKALTPTAAIVKKYKCDPYKITSHLREKADKLKEGIYVHPDEAKWKAAVKRINQMTQERIATLDGDFQDAEDEFVLGIRKIQELPEVYDALEAREW